MGNAVVLPAVRLTPEQKDKFNPYGLSSIEDLARLPEEYHAILPPSGMGRILKCPASVMESIFHPQGPSSEAAMRGTLLHEVVANTALKTATKIPKLDEEDSEQVKTCLDVVDYFNNLAYEEDLDIALEGKSSLALFGIPFIHGTSDLVVKPKNGGGHCVYVRDWKFGGVKVNTIIGGMPNAQLLLYGLMNIDPYNPPEYLDIGIVQPPLNYSESVKIKAESAIEWYKRHFVPVIIEAMDDGARYNPGDDQCRFCPAAIKCRARNEHALQAARQVFKLAQKIDKAKEKKSDLPITKDELIATYLFWRKHKKYLPQVEKYLLSEILDGNEYIGLKAVHGRNSRSFKNDRDAATYLVSFSKIPDEKMFKSSLISPAQAEKLDRTLKKDGTFGELIDVKPGKPQLVLESDKREAVSISSEASRAFHEHKEKD